MEDCSLEDFKHDFNTDTVEAVKGYNAVMTSFESNI